MGNYIKGMQQGGREIMLTAVSGYYNGQQIVMDEEINLRDGQRVIITILEPESVSQKDKRVSLKKYVGRGEKMFVNDASEYVKGLREDDRL